MTELQKAEQRLACVVPKVLPKAVGILCAYREVAASRGIDDDRWDDHIMYPGSQFRESAKDGLFHLVLRHVIHDTLQGDERLDIYEQMFPSILIKVDELYGIARAQLKPFQSRVTHDRMNTTNLIIT